MKGVKFGMGMKEILELNLNKLPFPFALKDYERIKRLLLACKNEAETIFVLQMVYDLVWTLSREVELSQADVNTVSRYIINNIDK